VSASPATLGPAHKKARLVSAFFKGQPISCTWQVTPRCGSLCVFCEHRAEGATGELDLAGCRQVAAALTRMGSLVVSLSGGDPFLRSDLPDLVRDLARTHFPIVTTHGWLVTREKARELWQGGLEAATLTLDHADASRQDEAAGVPGFHARALLALQALSRERTRASQQVNVKARLDAGDLSGLPALLALAADHGATVSVEPAFPLNPEVPGHEAEGSGGRRRETAVVRARLRELKGRHPNLRTSHFFLEHLDAALAGGVPGCQAGRAFFNVDHRGQVSKCVEFRTPADRAGNFVDDAPSAVLPRLRAIQASNTCRACWYTSRGEVEGLYTLRGFLGGVTTLVRA
jgi:MoaA/NifB/PqqE/SkfB family radical SAM enzyme